MRLKTFLIVSSIVSALLGAWFLVFTTDPGAKHTSPQTPEVVLLAWTVGVLMICLALVSYSARNSGMTPATRGILWAILLFHFESTIQGVYEITRGLVYTPGVVQNIGHFSTHLFFVFTSLYYLFVLKDQKKI